jgi:ATP-binding cassette subfamily B protein
MFVYDWRLSCICLIPILIGFGILYYMLKDESEGFAKQYQRSAEDISNAVTEYVRGVAVVKVFRQTANSFRRYKAAVKEYGDYLLKYALSMQNADSAYHAAINGIFFFLIPGGIILFNASSNPEKTVLSFLFFSVLIPTVVTILARIMNSSSNLMLSRRRWTQSIRFCRKSRCRKRKRRTFRRGMIYPLTMFRFLMTRLPEKLWTMFL